MILIKLFENKLFVIGFHAHKAQIITAFMNSINNAAAVALGNNKINIIVAFAECRQYFRKNIGGWNCRNAKTNHLGTVTVPAADHVISEFQNVLGTFKKFHASRGDFKAFGCAYDEP